jgi:Amt family ammonium transporter
MLKWFHGLKVAQKLALISFVFVIPDSVMLYLFITSINENIQFARLEQVGNEYQRPLEQLLHLVPQQRLEARRLGDKPPPEKFLARAHAIDQAFDAVEEVDGRTGKMLGFTPEGLAKRKREGCDVGSVRAEWNALKQQQGLALDVRDQRYLQLIDHVRAMIAHAGDMSNLILDPELDSYYLMDATLMALPQTQDRLSRVMGDAEDLLAANPLQLKSRQVTLAIDLELLKSDDLERIKSSVETALTSSNPLFGEHPTFQQRVPVALKAYADAASHFNDLTAELLNGDRAAVPMDSYFAAGEAARDAALNLWTIADEELNAGLLQGRIDYYTTRRMRSLGVAACALIASLGLVTFITKSISGPLKRQALQLRSANEELSRARARLEDRVVESHDALQRTEQKYRKIFENAVMGIFQVSPDGKFHSANPALAKIFGYDSPEKLVANDARVNQALYADPDSRALFRQLMDERGHVADFQSEIATKDGVRWISENARVVFDGHGDLLYYEGTVQDITQRKRAEAEERRAQHDAEAARHAAEAARKAAEAASTAKSDFLASMSHEIRTPLNGVVGVADLLAHTSLNAQQSRYVQLIQSSSAGLLAIINQILDFSKIEAGKLELAERNFDLPLGVEEVVAVLALKAASKGLELACQIDPRVPAHVHGDDDRLRQVLLNIVNNAIKFTAKGEVVIRVTLDGSTDGADADNHGNVIAVRFAVTDTGRGIPPERLNRLFKSFSQVDNSITRQYGGTGLGLAISKQLVELMGGQIGVESTPDKGSTFWFTVKLALQEAGTCEVPPFSLAGRRVVVVDDNQTQCRVLQDQLRAWGVEATTATGAAPALALLKRGVELSRPFDVAIIDLNMPQMSGLEMARILRAQPGLSDMPLILMSGIETMIAIDDSRLGQYLTKPIRQSNLLDAIMRAVTRPKEFVAAVHPAEVAPAAPAVSPKARKSVRILLAEDMEVNQFVVTETLAREGYSCDIAGNGREAVAAASARPYDIILMDCQMPEMSGFDATTAIRQRERALGPQAPRVTIVALTANAIAGDRERCLAAGMDEYLTKPLNPARLIRCIESLVPASIVVQASKPASPDGDSLAPAASIVPQASKPASSEAVGLEACTTTAPTAPVENQSKADARPSHDAFDYDDLLARCDGDKAMMERLIAKFQEKSARMWDDLLAGVAARDAAAITRLAHGLKGTASNLSAGKVAALAAKLEELGRADDLAAAQNLVSELGGELQKVRDAFGKIGDSPVAGPAGATTGHPAIAVNL